MQKKMIGFIGLLTALLVFTGLYMAQQSPLSQVVGEIDSKAFNAWEGKVFSAGTGSMTVSGGGAQVLRDGTVFYPFNVNAPLIVDYGQANAEVVTPTSISGCQSYSSVEPPNCTVTVAFTNTHGKGAIIRSGTLGLQEAINYAQARGGGQVTMDRPTVGSWGQISGLTGAPASFAALMAGLTPYQLVSIVDKSGPVTRYWNAAPSTATFLAAPAVLTTTTAGPWIGIANGVAGSASFGATQYACVAYVDVMGNEGPCSPSYTTTGVTLEAWGFLAPAASPGAVGYTIYLSVAGGSYITAYRVPLQTSAGVSTGVCTLTRIETTTPACALTNTTYGQTGVGAVVAAYPLVTQMSSPQLGPTDTSTSWIANVQGRTSYAYIPSNQVGMGGIVGSSLAFTAAPGPATTAPAMLGSIAIPPGYMNYVGKTIRVCGNMYEPTGGSATITNIQFYWDAQGSNVTNGYPVLINNMQITSTLTAIPIMIDFCGDIKTTVASTSVTGGSLLANHGFFNEQLITAGTISVAGTSITTGAIGSLNLAGEARLDIVYNHTTGTDGGAPILQNVTVEDVN